MVAHQCSPCNSGFCRGQVLFRHHRDEKGRTEFIPRDLHVLAVAIKNVVKGRVVVKRHPSIFRHPRSKVCKHIFSVGQQHGLFILEVKPSQFTSFVQHQRPRPQDGRGFDLAQPRIDESHLGPFPRPHVQHVQFIHGGTVSLHDFFGFCEDICLSVMEKHPAGVLVTYSRSLPQGGHKLPTLAPSMKSKQIEMPTPQTIAAQTVQMTVKHKVTRSPIETFHMAYTDVLLWAA